MTQVWCKSPLWGKYTPIILDCVKIFCSTKSKCLQHISSLEILGQSAPQIKRSYSLICSHANINFVLITRGMFIPADNGLNGF